MRKIEILPVQLSDCRILAKIHIQSWHETYAGLLPGDYLNSLDLNVYESRWLRNLESSISKRWKIIVDGEVCGFLGGGLARHRVSSCRYELYAIYLLERFKNSGIGSYSFSFFREWVKNQNSEGFYLWVLQTNHKAISFYEKMGGKLIKEANLPFLCPGFSANEICYEFSSYINP